jgi:S1-C subfamily serine protease
MTRLLPIMLLLATAGSGFAQNGAPANEAPANHALVSSNQSAIALVRERVQPAVVSILVVRQDFSGGEARLSLTSGSGTIITRDGYVATNAHVIDNGQRFRVVLNDQREFQAQLAGSDPVSDLALLKIIGGNDLPTAEFNSDISDLRAGDGVIAMGAPMGLRDSLSVGVLNNTRRLLVSLFEDEADYEQSLNEVQRTARYYAWLQHDAAISPGNSGGPLVDLKGRVIGVNTRGNLFGGDMAFSVPAPVAKRVFDALMKSGSVERSDFGFGVRSLRGSGLQRGAIIATVERDSSAEKAGLRPGDVLLSVDGKDVSLPQPELVPDFRRSLSERAVGSSIKLVIQRNKEQITANVSSVRQNDAKPREQEIAHFGMTASEITSTVARSRLLDSTQGVLISGLRAGGPCSTAQPALLSGDRIVSVNGEAVKSLSDFVRLAGELTPEPKAVVLTVERRGQQLLSELQPAPKRIIPPVNPELAKAWAGMDVQPVPGTLAAAFKLPESGFRITRIYPEGPAAKAGLKVGDLITQTNGIAVKPSGLKETSALDLRIRNAERAQPFALTIRRGAESITAKLNLLDEPQGTDRAKRLWDSTLSVMIRELTFSDRNDRKLSDAQKGLILERVENGGSGGLAYLRDGDLLVNINGKNTHTVEDFQRTLADLRALNAAKLSFLVIRAGDTRILFVDAPWIN